MISFDLKCRDHGHAFEGWFASSATFQDQLAKGWVACPTCGATDVVKALSVPNVGAKSNRGDLAKPAQSMTEPAPGPSMSAPTSLPSLLPPAVREILAKVAEAQAEALKSSEWVGPSLVEEVRAQRYGEAETRPVHGEASPSDAQELAEEGIAIMPILFPITPPDRRN